MYNFQNNQNPKLLYHEVYTEEEANELFQDLTGRLKCVMSVVNSAAYTTMVEAIDHVKKTPYYKGKVKMLYNKAIKAYEEHTSDLKWGKHKGIEFFAPRTLGQEEIDAGVKPATLEQVFDMYLDIGAFAYKRSCNELEMLRWQVLQAYTKHQIEYRNELSYATVANAIVEYSCNVYDQMMVEFHERTHVKFNNVFKPFRLTATYKYFNEATELLALVATKPEQRVDINNEDNIRTAFRVFENAIMADLCTMESADEAIRENKDLLSGDVYERYTTKYDAAMVEHNKKIENAKHN